MPGFVRDSPNLARVALLRMCKNERFQISSLAIEIPRIFFCYVFKDDVTFVISKIVLYVTLDTATSRILRLFLRDTI